jgi:DNA replication protein DnaC
MFKLDELKIRRRSWVKMAGIPTARLGWTLKDCSEADQKDIAIVSKWLKAVKDKHVIRSAGQPYCGKGLMLFGTPGQGKTTIALSTIQEIMTTMSLDSLDVKEGGTLIRPCYFITYYGLLELKGTQMGGSITDDQEVILEGILGNCPNDAYNIRVLVLDDVGKEHATDSEWQRNTLHHVLRTRFNNGLPTIITTNIRREDWAGLYGDSTASFVHEIFGYLPVESSRGDLRK